MSNKYVYKKDGYKSIKIFEKHYNLIVENKKNNGTPIAFYVGQAIEAIEKQKLQKQK
jgi:hypothetical protein